jgi:hypothetical protein
VTNREREKESYFFFKGKKKNWSEGRIDRK